MSRKQGKGPIDIYARESKARSKTKVSTTSQVRACRVKLDERGLPVGKVFVDDGKSGWNPKVLRDGWEAAMERLEKGISGGLIVYDLNRFTRQLFTDGKRMIDAAKSGAIIYDSEDRYDLRNYRDRSRFIQAIERAEYQSAQTSDFVTRGLGDAAKAGLFTGGPRVFGFEPGKLTVRSLDKNGEPMPGSEAWWINWAADRIIDGWTLTRVCKALDDEDIHTDRQRKTGNGWKPVNLSQVLRRPSMAGFATYKGAGAEGKATWWEEDRITGEAPYPAIIPEDKWRELRQVLKEDTRWTGPRHTGGSGPKPQYLGSLIYQCGECRLAHDREEFMRGGKTQYWCKHGDHPGPHGGKARAEGGFVIQAAKIDEYVVSRLIEGFRQPDCPLGEPEETETDELAILDARETKLIRRQKEANMSAATDDAYMKAQWEEVTAGIGQELAEIAAQRAHYTERRKQTMLARIARHPDAAGIWEGFTPEQKRAIIRDVCDVVIYRPRFRPCYGHGWDPECVIFKWKPLDLAAQECPPFGRYNCVSKEKEP
jgi:DNA invertase Pin-like site-specific DNA recombinase